MSTVAIVGAGHAGYQTAASLRQLGFAGRVTLISDEPGLPYQRPPLSKAYLLGSLDERRLLHRQEKWYADQTVDLLHDAAVRIDRTAHAVETASGARVPYDHLVLATGARNRELPVPGRDLLGVRGMRTKEDADAVAGWLGEGVRVVVVGAGFIGLEFASVAVARGAQVHVLELAERSMARGLSRPTAELVRRAHERWGVTFDFEQSVASINGEDGRVRSVTTSDGRTLPVDLVIYGIGVLPNTDLAAEAGLAVADGIQVDAHLLTTDPDISAVGDAACFPCSQLGGALTRLESVQNAADQARHVAFRLTGQAGPYEALPWFWSDQGTLKIQIAGLSRDYDRTVELAHEPDDGSTVLCFSRGRLVAVETINRPADHMAARRLLTGLVPLTPEDAARSDFQLLSMVE